MKQLKAQDAQFLFMEDGRVAAHVTSVMICDQSTAPGGIVRFKEILSTIETRLGNAPLYSQKLMRLPFNVDFPYWVEDQHFDLEYHVRHGRLPEPSDWRQLCIQIARFHSRPLDLTRPPWEVQVIEGLDNVDGCTPGSFALLIKMHHAAVDGTSAQEFMFSMMDLAPEGPPMIPPPSGRRLVRESAVSSTQLAMRAAFNNARAPFNMARAAARLAPTVAAATAKRLTGNADSVGAIPSTRFNRDVSPNRAFDGVAFDLADFKKIAASLEGAKINDVVLAVSSGALRTYLKSKNELPEETLVITAPINKRGNETSEGNDISAMSVPLYTNIADPLDRIKAIILASQAAKAAKSGLLTRIATDLSQHVPPFTLATLGPLLVSAGAGGERTGNAIISNVPGVQIPLYFCGAKITDTYGLAPIGAGMGLFIATPSYNGRIYFSITTTRQMMPDTPFFINCLKRSLAELLALAETRQARKKAPQQKKKTFHRTRMTTKPVPPKRKSVAKPVQKKSKRTAKSMKKPT